MTWYVYAIVSAIFTGVFSLLLKKYLKDTDSYVLGAGVFLSTFAIMFGVSLIKGIPELGASFYYATLATAVLNVIAHMLWFRSLEIEDLSLVSPIQAFTPAFLIITSFVMLGEAPNYIGFAGIITLVIGLYILNSNENRSKFFTPLLLLFKNKGMFFMLLVAILFSVSSNFDKIVVINSDAVFGSAVISLITGLSFFALSFTRKKIKIRSYSKSIRRFVLIGVVLAISHIAINIALTMEIVPYVTSIKRLSILFSVVLGIIIFGEKNPITRIIGSLIMIVGAIAIILFG